MNRAVYASCDAADGVKDGLIQNPGKCGFDPKSLLCQGSSTENCLTPHQVDTLTAMVFRGERPAGPRRELWVSGQRHLRQGAPGANLFVWAEASGPPLDINAAEPWGETMSQQPTGWSGYDQGLQVPGVSRPDVRQQPSFSGR